MLNKVSLIGRLGRDPEVRRLNGGDRVVNMRIATTERWKDKDGEKQERTEWHSIVIWNEGLGTIAEKHLHKGDLVYLEGQLQTRKWEKNNEDHYSTEVVLQKFRGELRLLPKASRSEDQGNDQGESRSSSRSRSEDRREPDRKQSRNDQDFDDDIPF